MVDFNPMEHMTKEVVKEAFKEWLDEKSAEFGKWTLNWIKTVLFGMIIYYAANHGWLR